MSYFPIDSNQSVNSVRGNQNSISGYPPSRQCWLFLCPNSMTLCWDDMPKYKTFGEYGRWYLIEPRLSPGSFLELSYQNQKSIRPMKDAKTLPEEVSVCSAEECLNWIGKRVLTKTYYHQEPNPLQEGLVLGFRLILRIGESIDSQKSQKLFLVQILDSGDLVERYLEEMEVVS